ncbi:MAG: hypothetical protein ACYSUB_14675 [Planctomycetota bacterium]|jgi:hypothetical protein
MSRARILNTWPVISAFLLIIAGTSGANGETINSDVRQSTNVLAATAADPNGPTILKYDINIFHQLAYGQDYYRIDAYTEVYDPQGPGDIATIKAIDANDNEFILGQPASGGYYGNREYGSTPPPLGNTQIVAIDQSGNSDTVSENLTNVVEELPTMLFPRENEVISETQPVFDWADVTDEQSAITYTINVCHEDWTSIWRVSNLTESEVQFNIDSSANELLQDGMSYRWSVHALDIFGNTSYSFGKFEIGTLIDYNAPKILLFDITTFHERDNYRIDAWADVNDPQGLGDIATVKGIDAIGHEFIFKYEGLGIHGSRYCVNHSYGSKPPPLGNARIVAIDQSGKSDVVRKSLTNIIEKLPTIIFPKEYGAISEIQPVFDWADVTDEQSTITYSINVYHPDFTKVWGVINLTESQAQFNFDGNATEALQDGMSYRWEVHARDTFGNESYADCSFKIGTLIDYNGPIILKYDINIFHQLAYGRDYYRIDAYAEVYDPQGPGDIATIKAIDANGNEFILGQPASGGYYGNREYGSTPPPLGNTQIVAIDQSGNFDTISENLTNVVEELPTMLFPRENEVISETQPVFDWADVTDELSAITYSINIYHQDRTKIWSASNLTESQVQFNYDGSANEALQDGMSYWWEVNAYDTFGNSSYSHGSLEIGTPIIFGNVIILENDHLRIELHPTLPYVYRYVFNSNGEVIYGHIVNTEFVAQIFYQGTLHDVKPSVDSVTQESDRICYHMRTEIESKEAVTFDLSYILNDDTVQVVFNNITEIPGYRLVFVRSPSLLTVRSTQPGAKLVFPESEGKLIDIGSANSGDADIVSGWKRPLLAGMLYHDSLIGVIHYDHLDMMLWTRVIDHSSEGRLATIGMDFNYRYAPTNFSTAAFIDVFDSVTTDLTVGLTFLNDYDGDLDVDWMDGAKFLRDQVQATPDPRYLSSFITKIHKAGINWPTDYLRLIKRLYHLTDHNKIYGYLLEYNSRIFSIFGVEEDLWPHWPLEDFIEVFQDAEELYNTFLSFHDNYSDYYPGTPGYDPNLRVIQHDGTPWPGGPLPGFDEAFMADPYDYATNVGIDRVRNTLERYPIKESHHIDVLSGFFPKDYSQNSPSSRERNRRGVQLIIDEFDKAGVDVTSEGLTGQCAESGIGWFLHIMWRPSSDLPFVNEESIPLMAFIYHGKTLYGSYEGLYSGQLHTPQAAIHALLDTLLLGTSSGTPISWDSLGIDKFYLIDLPWMALNQRFMEDYQEQGSRRRITYDADTFVEVDYEQNTYIVQVDGRIIAENYTTCFPKSQNRFLIFSRYAKEISVKLPQKWLDENQRIIELHALTEEGVGDVIPFQISDANLTFSAEANTPYRLDLVD